MANENMEIRTQDQAQAQEIRQRRAVAPSVDVYENADEYLVLADLPGVSREDIDIQFDRGELTLHARRQGGHDGSLNREFAEVDFRRTFRVPEKVDTQDIGAELDQGVLRLRLPKSPELRPRKIQVKAA
jgi:HSP20 family protein